MKKARLIVLVGILACLTVYFITPQKAWVPQFLKKIIFSCYKEGANLPSISTQPECCYGLHTEAYPDKNGSPVIGAVICKGGTKPGSSFETQIVNTPSPTEINKLRQNNELMKFTSKNEGFSLIYPIAWTIRDTSSGNCGNRAEINGSTCYERFDFISPDGILVRYVELSNTDKWGCGLDSLCWIDTIESISSMNITNLGKIYLVKSKDAKHNQQNAPKGYYYEDIDGMYLHKPISNDTMPKIGENIFRNYAINYSLPSKHNGRIKISFIKNEEFKDLPSEEYFKLPSVKEAEQILRSFSYE